MRLLRRLEKNHDGIRSAATRQHYIQIHQAIKNIDQVVKQNLSATRQSEQAAQDLNNLGTQLAGLLTK